MATPDLNDLRALAVSLPPSERAMGGEAADILSALIAVGHYGTEIIDAAKDGKIADFYHDKIVAQAKAQGSEEPRRGSAAVATPAPVSAAPHVDTALRGEVATLKADLAKLVALLTPQAGGTTDAAPAAPADPPTPAPDPDPTSAPAASDATTGTQT